MPDPETPEPAEMEGQEATQKPEENPVDWESEAKKWQAISKKTEADNKRNAARLKEFEDADKTELEKAQARAAAAEKSAADAVLNALRAQVALDKKLTPSQAKRLVGTTQEELEADADELLADLKNITPGSAPSSDGQGKQGDVVGQTKQITSRDELKSMSREEKLAAYRDGRLKSLTG